MAVSYTHLLPKKRYERTLAILKKYAPQGATILDVGVVNPFSELMQAEGYTVRNKMCIRDRASAVL